MLIKRIVDTAMTVLILNQTLRYRELERMIPALESVYQWADEQMKSSLRNKEV